MPYFPPVGGSILPLNSIDNTVLADMIAVRIKGRALGAGLGDPTDLTGAQIAAILNADPGPGAFPLLATMVAAGSTSLDFTLFDPAKYAKYIVDFVGIKPSVDNAQTWMRLSLNGGASFDATNNYGTVNNYSHTGSAGSISGTWGIDALVLTPGVGSAYIYATTTVEVFLDYVNNKTSAMWRSGSLASGGTFYSTRGAGQWVATPGLANAFRLQPSSGLFTLGTAKVYGVPK